MDAACHCKIVWTLEYRLFIRTRVKLPPCAIPLLHCALRNPRIESCNVRGQSAFCLGKNATHNHWHWREPGEVRGMLLRSKSHAANLGQRCLWTRGQYLDQQSFAKQVPEGRCPVNGPDHDNVARELRDRRLGRFYLCVLARRFGTTHNLTRQSRGDERDHGLSLRELVQNSGCRSCAGDRWKRPKPFRQPRRSGQTAKVGEAGLLCPSIAAPCSAGGSRLGKFRAGRIQRYPRLWL